MKIYTDGTCSGPFIGWAFVVVDNCGKKVHERYGIVDEPELQQYRVMIGEIRAVVRGIEWAKAHAHNEIEIHYDWECLESWFKDLAKGKSVKSIYKKEVASFISNMTVDWVKVRAHSGNKWNDHAHELCGKATKEAHEIRDQARGTKPQKKPKPPKMSDIERLYWEINHAQS